MIQERTSVRSENSSIKKNNLEERLSVRSRRSKRSEGVKSFVKSSRPMSISDATSETLSDLSVNLNGNKFELPSEDKISLHESSIRRKYNPPIVHTYPSNNRAEEIVLKNHIIKLDERLGRNEIRAGDLEGKNLGALQEIYKSFDGIRSTRNRDLKMNNNLIFYRVGLLVMNGITTFGCGKMLSIDMQPYFKTQIDNLDVYIAFLRDMYDDDEIDDMLEDVNPFAKIALIHLLSTGCYIGAVKFMNSPDLATTAQNAALGYCKSGGEGGLLGSLGKFFSNSGGSPIKENEASSPQPKKKPSNLDF